MFGFLDGVEELSHVDKKGTAADINAPFFSFSLAIFVLRKVSETNIWFQFIKTQPNDGPGLGFKKILQTHAWKAFFHMAKVLLCQ